MEEESLTELATVGGRDFCFFYRGSWFLFPSRFIGGGGGGSGGDWTIGGDHRKWKKALLKQEKLIILFI